MRLADLHGRRVAVWGTGREGRAAIAAIAPHGPADLFAVEDRATFLSAHDGLTVPLFQGDDAHAALARAEVVVRSPGVAQVHPWIRELRERGVPITGGTALWLADHAAKAIGVTGSKGKSTTANLIAHLLNATGRPAVLGGNIGVAVLSLPPADSYVLELSAYQCADLADSPAIVVLTSLFPEHLDWSGGEEEYYADKLNIVAHDPLHVVFNGSDPQLALRLGGRGLPLVPTGGPESFHIAKHDGQPWVWREGRALFPRAAFPLVGRHNSANLCVALGAIEAAGFDCVAERTALAEALPAYPLLQHRLTPIEDPSGLTFVDDSLSTIPQATVHAIEAYADRPLTVLVGGEDRGVDYGPLRDFLQEHAITATVVGLPDSGPRILDVLSDVPTLTLVAADDLAAAVGLARARTPAGGVVLLSPAAPSYGRFDNYEHRSRVFREAIAATRPVVAG